MNYIIIIKVTAEDNQKLRRLRALFGGCSCGGHKWRFSVVQNGMELTARRVIYDSEYTVEELRERIKNYPGTHEILEAKCVLEVK